MKQPPPPGSPDQPQPPGAPDQPPPYGAPYGQPPGYDQQWGYGPPGNPGHPQQGAPVTSDDTTWAMMAYLGTLIIGFIAPLIIYFAKRDSPFSRHHSAQALNYQITILIQMLAPLLVAIPLAIALDSPVWFLLLLPPFLVHLVGQWVVLIMGTVKAGKGEYYRLPTWTCFRMIR